jgi:hypothetical protein
VAEHARAGLRSVRERVRRLANDRTKLLEELDKTGGVPKVAELPDDASIEALNNERRRLDRQEESLYEDYMWLQKELAKRKK